MNPPDQKANLFSYVLDHQGDPANINGRLILGVQNCKERMRPSVKVGDWVIATIGKKLRTKEMGEECNSYLAYAMKVTEVYTYFQLQSNEFYVFFNKPIKLSADFFRFIKVGQGYKRFPHKENERLETRLIEKFGRWVRRQNNEIIEEVNEETKKSVDVYRAYPLRDYHGKTLL